MDADTEHTEPAQPSDATVFLTEIQAIKSELQKLNASPLITNGNAPAKALAHDLMKGIAFGLGSFLGATLMVSLLVFILSQIQFIPIIGELVKSVIHEIQK